MNTGLDLSTIYQLRNKFTIIAMTGRTCSGCTTISKQLGKGFDDGRDYPSFMEFELTHNSYRKYKIIYNYARINFKPFTVINYKDILTLFLLSKDFDEFINFLSSKALIKEFEKSKLAVKPDFSKEIVALKQLKGEFINFQKSFRDIDLENIKQGDNLDKLFKLFDDSKYKEFSSRVLNSLALSSVIKRNKVLQIIANNLRRSGSPYVIEDAICPECIFTIAELMNDVIKAYNKINSDNETETRIVIDSLRNPIEIMFFKQRFSAFYLVAINRDSESREEKVRLRFGNDYEDIQKLLKEEYQGGKGSEFYKQYVSDCIQKADIHITYRSFEEAQKRNANLKNKRDNTSPYFSWQMQLLKYVSLIAQPGLVTPSPEERCMQIAYTAKYNSGCISRQVGATVTDENYSIKAIGWNNTPEGQVPCNLRNAEDLLTDKDDITAFSPYERTDPEFRSVLVKNFQQQIKDNVENLCGRNVCFCFKTLKNSFSEGKNQVHTRSLHAEESAFLQITKYGGNGVKGGKLFTTASPCELCSKKAYQLNIKVIYYIDPYPGISKTQILEAGTPEYNPEVRLFNGAIGSAYHWLYQPFMAYKDELTLLLGNKIDDKLTKIQEEFTGQEKVYKQDIEDLKKRIKELEGTK